MARRSSTHSVRNFYGPGQVLSFCFTTSRSEYKLFFISHKSLTLTKVNTYGLLYEWKGSDDGLKPLLLTGHQGLPVNHVDCTH
jgi:hypothetical protein